MDKSKTGGPRKARRSAPRKASKTVGSRAAFTDVNALPVVSTTVAAQIKAAALLEGNLPDSAPIAVPVRAALKPGVERWPVKTGVDADVASVGENLINGRKLGAGIVPATVEELIGIPRPPGMRPATRNFDHAFHAKRLGVVEATVWTVDAEIVALKHESDGDYHLVLQGATGERMVAEIPTPAPPFVPSSCPWLPNMETARDAVDRKLVSKLLPRNFARINGAFVPREAVPASQRAVASRASVSVRSFVAPKDSRGPLILFKTAITPTKARVTGVGFFDSVHGQMGVALLNGIELHPVLKIEWL